MGRHVLLLDDDPAKQLKNDAHLERVPIIMISSVGEATGAANARELGGEMLPGDAFLEKPLDPHEFCRLVSRNVAAASRMFDYAL